MHATYFNDVLETMNGLLHGTAFLLAGHQIRGFLFEFVDVRALRLGALAKFTAGAPTGRTAGMAPNPREQQAGH